MSEQPAPPHPEEPPISGAPANPDAQKSGVSKEDEGELDADFFDDVRCEECGLVDESALAEAEARFKRRDIPDALIWLERALGFEFYDLAEQVRRFYEKAK